MKISRFVSLFLLLGFASSCAFFNDKNVELAINSNPAGADIFIEGRSYGVTPAVIKVPPRRYLVTLTKDGYGSAVFNTEVWGAVRSDVNGNSNADGKRCLMDAMSVFFFFNLFTEKCADFKQKEYFINIQKTGNASNGNSSLIGIGNNPQNAINYYYGQGGYPNKQGFASPQGSNQPNPAYPNPYPSY